MKLSKQDVDLFFESNVQQLAILKPSKALKNWKPEFDKLVTRTKKLRGGGGQPAIYSPAFSLVKASLELGQSAVSDPDDLDTL